MSTSPPGISTPSAAAAPSAAAGSSAAAAPPAATTEAYLAAATVLQQIGRPAHALALLQSAAGGSAGSRPDYRLRLGLVYLDLKLFGEAVAELRTAAQLADGEAPGRRDLRAQARAAEGIALQKMGRHHDAVIVLSEAAREYQAAGTPCPDVAAAIGHSHALLERFPEALRSYDQAIGWQPDNADVLRARARVLRETGRLDEALRGFDAALRARPAFVEAALGRAETLQLMGRHDEAAGAYERALAMPPDGPAGLLAQAQTLVELGRVDEAEARFDRLVQAHPDDVASRIGRAVFLRGRCRFEEAIEDLGRAIAHEPQNARTLALRGETYLRWALSPGAGGGEAVTPGQQRERFALAATDFGRIIEMTPDLAWPWASRGEIYRHMHRDAEALCDFTQALSRDADFPFALSRRGDVHRGCGRHAEAAADFERALELQPDDSWSLAHLADVYRRLDRPDEARECFRRALEVRPGYPWALAKRAQFHLEQGDAAAAGADIEAALAAAAAGPRTRTRDWLHYLRGLLALLRGDRPAAAEALREAVAIVDARVPSDSFNVRNLFNRALYVLAAGDASALDAYRRALEHPSRPRGAILQEAARDVRDLLRVLPDHPRAAEAVRLLESARAA